MKEATPGTRDTECIRQVLDGNVDAFRDILARHGPLVRGIVGRHIPRRDFEDVSQEIFVRAYVSLPGFLGKTAFKSWLSSLAVRTCCDYWRKVYRSREVPLSGLTDGSRDWLEAAVSMASEEVWKEAEAREEAGAVLDWALGHLGPTDRMVLSLVYLEGHSVAETAALLGWTETRVKVCSFRARRKLEKVLKREGIS